jgi:antitoxin component YwqK of YwqJK toxin-antitoxin module
MRNNAIILTLCLLFATIGYAQKVEPKYEKQDDLVKVSYFFDSGELKEVGYFKENKLHGQWVAFNEEGKKVTIANYENGKKVGTWYVVTNDSVKELVYDANKLVSVKDINTTEITFI